MLNVCRQDGRTSHKVLQLCLSSDPVCMHFCCCVARSNSYSRNSHQLTYLGISSACCDTLPMIASTPTFTHSLTTLSLSLSHTHPHTPPACLGSIIYLFLDLSFLLPPLPTSFLPGYIPSTSPDWSWWVDLNIRRRRRGKKERQR